MGTAGEGEGKCAGLLAVESLLACSVFYLRLFFVAPPDEQHSGSPCLPLLPGLKID
jgi:hypothetical protein